MTNSTDDAGDGLVARDWLSGPRRGYTVQMNLDWAAYQQELARAASAFDQFRLAAEGATSAFEAWTVAFPQRRYNRLRWRLDSLVRTYLPVISSARATRRLRVWIEHTVEELES